MNEIDSLEFRYNDGGRSKYYKAKHVRDCVCRAISIASGTDYKDVYNMLWKFSNRSPRNGVDRKIYDRVIRMLGGKWFPCMTIGSGCHVHLCAGEIPMSGRIICSLSGHLVAVIDGVINDTFDCSLNGYRCVYGYWVFK